MAYDVARGVTVLFGGYTGANNGETWEWNGTTWTQRTVSGPSPRAYHAMAYDVARGVTVLFGGSGADTWEWNGTSWAQRIVSGPSARAHHAMDYDAARGITVLFGGYAGAYNAETWEWNGTAWTQRAVSGPSARIYPGMAYDAARGVTVLFGGYTGTSNGETWEWNGTAWARRVVSGASPRINHAMAYDAARGVTVLFGGYNNGLANGETWEWNGTDWTQRTMGGPSARIFPAMAYDAARGRTVMFGGYTGVRNGETWEWNGAAWTERVVSGPSPREGHAMAYDSIRGVAVVFGGYTGVRNGETWEWNGAAWTQRVVSGPSPRNSHGMAYDAARRVTVLFGGYTGASNGETWEWNGTAWTQRMVSGPSPRFYHAMAYDAARAVTVLFGGETTDADTWEWDGTAWTRRVVSGPTRRSKHAMAYDTARGVTVLFGGITSGGRNGETWEWNGTAWTQRAIDGPSPRAEHVMAYHAARSDSVLFGGNTGSINGETWILGVLCAPGLVRDCNGNCAPASWIGDGYCDNGYYSYNGVPIYFNCPQFGNDGGDCAAPPPPIQNPPNHGVPVPPPQYSPPPPPPAPTQRNLVLVTHGANTTQEKYLDFWVPFAQAIDDAVGQEWQVELYDWTDDSFIFFALGEAARHGTRYGNLVAGRHYDHVHLIAHSAGAALIANVAAGVRALSPNTTIHTTYLDAYAGVFPGFTDYVRSYGRDSDWSDYYYSQEPSPLDPCTSPEPCLGTYLATGPYTEQYLPNSFNLDVSLSDPNYNAAVCPLVFDSLSSHQWPTLFYRYTVNRAGEVGCLPPTVDPQSFGFQLSYEYVGGDVAAWISNVNSTYPTGDDRSHPEGGGTGNLEFRAPRDAPLDLGATPSYSSPDGVQVTAGVLTMTTQPPGLIAPQPAWINFQISTITPVNFVAFDMEFVGTQGATGLVTVYVDGTQCGIVEEQYALSGTQPYSVPTLGELAPGEHVVSFRLDPDNVLVSTITIQGVATGFARFVEVELCDPDINCDGAVNGFDIEAAEQAINGDYSNFCQASADLNGDGAENGFDIETEEQRVNGEPCP